jgi:hypothetical protein
MLDNIIALLDEINEPMLSTHKNPKIGYPIIHFFLCFFLGLGLLIGINERETPYSLLKIKGPTRLDQTC